MYFIFILPALLVGILAQILLSIWTKKYHKQKPISGLNGAQIVEKIANNRNFPIELALTTQKLGDNYNPTNHTLTLSQDIAQTASITAVGIAAHELGHVEQHQLGSTLLRIRTLIVPALNIGTNIGYFLLIFGIVLGATNLAWIGIVLFSGTVIFSVITLPIEIDASRRALHMLQAEQILLPQELPGVKRVLSAAALTYIASTIQSVGTLFYFLLRIQGGGRKN